MPAMETPRLSKGWRSFFFIVCGVYSLGFLQSFPFLTAIRMLSHSQGPVRHSLSQIYPTNCHRGSQWFPREAHWGGLRKLASSEVRSFSQFLGIPEHGLIGPSSRLYGPSAFTKLRLGGNTSAPRHRRLEAARRGQGPLDPRRSIRKVPKRAIDKASSNPCSGAESQKNAALALRLAALRKVKETEEAKSAFPVALRLPHPELVAGVTYRRLGSPLAQQIGRHEPRQKSGHKEQYEQQRVQQDGPLVSSLCVGTSLIGGNMMQGDEEAFKMLCTAYEDYGINFYDVGELDPLPHAPQHCGSGHRGVLRRFFRKYRGLGGGRSGTSISASPDKAAASSATAATFPATAVAAEGHLRAEAQQLCVSVRLLSGSLGAFDYERLALERKRKEAVGCAAAHEAAEAGASASEIAAAAAAAVKAASLTVGRETEGSIRWARPMGWWAREPYGTQQLTARDLEAAVDNMLNRLGIDCIDILQLSDPNRYVPRQELGEDTYCWGLERPDAVPIEEQLEMLSGLMQKGKVRYIGVSNETAFGIFKWVQAAEEMSLPRIVSSQHLYNIMHRNELETSGIPEIASRLGVPVLAYGALAGGILTGKYLDPERFHSKGPDVRQGQDELESGIGTYRYRQPEDFGYLSYGPSTGRANLWPSTYHTHRSVWAQWLMGELVKAGREYGLTAAQLALCWVYSRPFVASTIIVPRTLGQLRESVRTQNYAMHNSLSQHLHELYMHYSAPTMGGPQLLSHLPDPECKAQPPLSQSDFMKWGKQPIWSGGTYWDNWPQPVLAEKLEYYDRLDLAREVKAAAGALDDPSDEGVINVRLWRERLDEGLPGEYFAVKEQKLFGWDQHTVDGGMLREMTASEKQEQHHFDWHLCWKGGKVQRVPTTDSMKAFYGNWKATSEVIHDNFKAFKDLTLHREQLGDLVPELWNRWDYDLIAKRCYEKHGIDIYEPKLWDNLELGETSNTRAHHERLAHTRAFWYFEHGGYPNKPLSQQTGSDTYPK
ncbi:hypothetical protein, conserved [Eimeria tenella]|uniref:NADP-dependent oxidoreductase domain-containing protein n=1 Tax=Eimeria tenella TaxID=5802 RepID=U6KN02_EIMTE|nr:hypothetical protein, conserved [Eimeria tenella]CDJ38211.1 hypothetical protein, conserved [Eimeria tenella]|eukprot:XP_013229049.1 hypothetical protein, conserved [Eimeria tenella]